MNALFAVFVLLLLGCQATTTPARPVPTSVRLQGPRPQGMDAMSDPFADRREVSSEASAVVGGFGASCHAGLFVGSQTCFVRGGRVVERSREPDDAGIVSVQSEVPFEYWLACGESAQPCSSAPILKCVCR